MVSKTYPVNGAECPNLCCSADKTLLTDLSTEMRIKLSGHCV